MVDAAGEGQAATPFGRGWADDHGDDEMLKEKGEASRMFVGHFDAAIGSFHLLAQTKIVGCAKLCRHITLLKTVRAVF